MSQRILVALFAVSQVYSELATAQSVRSACRVVHGAKAANAR